MVTKPVVFFSILFFTAIILRIPAIFCYPLFEDDHHRYLWDAKVWASGENPYIFAPEDEEVEHLRDENWKDIGYKEVSTIYPPFAQIIFRLNYTISGGSLVGLKILFALADLLVIIFLIKLLNLMGRPLWNCIIYAWNPLVLKEVSNSAHIDIIMILMVGIYMWFYLKKKYVLAAILLSCAILTKFFPLLFLPVFFNRSQWKYTGIFILTGAVLYFPFLDEIDLMFQGLITYGRFWEFNDSGFLLIKWISILAGDSEFLLSKLILVLGMVSLIIWFLKNRHPANSLRSFFNYHLAVTGFVLIFSPVVDPWYCLWILPFLVLQPRISWIYLTCTVGLSYLYFISDRDFWWIRVILYGPFYLILVYEGRFWIRKIIPGETRKYQAGL